MSRRGGHETSSGDRPPRRQTRTAGPAEHDGMAIGGRRTVAEAVRAGRAGRVLVLRGSRPTQGLRVIMAEAERAGIPVDRVDPEAFDRLRLRDHQGVAAVVTALPELDERALSSVPFDPQAIVVILDGIADPQNLGSAGRSAEAAGASVLVIRKRRAASVTPAAVRASAGALLQLPVARVANIARAIERLKDRGFFVVGLDQETGRSLHEEARPPRPLAMVVGSEESGMSRLVREACDLLVAIPMPGTISSLNASAALAVGLFGYALKSGDPAPADVGRPPVEPGLSGEAGRSRYHGPRWRGAVR